MMLKKLFSFLIFVQVCVPLSAQDLTGTWVGGFGTTDLTIVLIKCGDHYVGHTYDSDFMGFCKTNFEANFDTTSKKFKGKSMGFIAHAGMHSQTNYNFRYSVSDGQEQLRGAGTPKSVFTKILSFGIPIMGITLTKESDKVDTTEFMHAALMQQVGIEKSIATTGSEKTDSITDPTGIEILAYQDSLTLNEERQSRTNRLLETIRIPATTVQFTVYDNGVEDGDSISILYNNRVLKSHMRVAVKPVSFKLTLDEDFSEHDITLIAHNLGTIPPNTATVEIQAGEKIHRIRASANMERNAVIRLKVEARQE